MMVARLPEGEREWKEEGEMEAVEGQPRKKCLSQLNVSMVVSKKDYLFALLHYFPNKLLKPP
jgi:hypothetical protein